MDKIWGIFPAFNLHSRTEFLYTYIMLEYSRLDSDKRLHHAVDFMVENITKAFDLQAVSNAANVSKFHLIRIFKEISGDTPNIFFRKLKVLHIDNYLKDHPNISLTDLAYNYGYSSSSVLSREYLRFMGVSPKTCKTHFQQQHSNILQIPDNILQAFLPG